MVDPNDEYPVTLYVNKQPRACFKSCKEAQGLMQLPHEHFYMSRIELRDASTDERWVFEGDFWAKMEKTK